MTRRFSLFCATAGVFLPLAAYAAESATRERRFAAPDVAGQIPTGTATGVGQVTLALVAVLAAVFAGAYLIRRLRGATLSPAAEVEVVSQVALGSRERAVIVRVGRERLLLGVAPGRVNLLHSLPPMEADSLPATTVNPSRPDFAALLRKALGR